MLVAERNGPAGNPYGRILGVLWGTRGEPVALADQSAARTMPVVDPELDQTPEQPQYVSLARAQREYFAKQRYLGIGFRRGTKYAPTWTGHPFTWTDEAFWMFDNVAKMCQFGNLFRGFACGQFDQLFNVDYPQTNLPFVILASNNPKDAPGLPYLDPAANNNAHLEQYYTFVGVAYRRAAPEMMPGLFRNPMRATANSDPYAATAYATVRVFIPSPRLVWVVTGSTTTNPGMPAGGVPGRRSRRSRRPTAASRPIPTARCRRCRAAAARRSTSGSAKAPGKRGPATASSTDGSCGSTGGWSTSIGRCNSSPAGCRTPGSRFWPRSSARTCVRFSPSSVKRTSCRRTWATSPTATSGGSARIKITTDPKRARLNDGDYCRPQAAGLNDGV